MSGTLPSETEEADEVDGSHAAESTSGEAVGTRSDGGAASNAETVSDAGTVSDEVTTDAKTVHESDAQTPIDDGIATAAPTATDPTGTRPGSRPESRDGASATADAESRSDESVRVCWLDDEDADDLIGALAPETARTILSGVHEEPRTASELAERADTSVQNVRHHVSKLVDAGLIAATDTRYSVKGREMTVYGPADDRVVVAVGGESDRSSLLDSLRGLLGAAALLAGASLLVQALFGMGVATLSGPATAPRIGDAVTGTGGAVLGGLSPGAAFFAGGVLVVVTVIAADRLRGR